MKRIEAGDSQPLIDYVDRFNDIDRQVICREKGYGKRKDSARAEGRY